MFEIEFTDSKGFTHRKIVPNHRIARELAKSVAVAAGRRAIVRKRKEKWTMLLVDEETRSIVQVCKGYNKKEVIEFWENWDVTKTSAIPIPWPESVSIPR